MMKQTHIFQLIQPPHAQPQHATLNTTPSYSPTKNIFQTSLPDKLTENELQHSKSYELVGIKELKALKNRAKKRTKVSVKDRDDLPSDRSVSRESCKKKTRSDPELLNKEEVIECLPKLSKEQSSQHLSRLHKASWIDAFTNFNLNTSTVTSKNMEKISKEFSVVRIKQKFIEHQNQWRRIFRSHKEGEKFPTLSESIAAFGKHKQEVARNPIDQNLVNIKSSFWSSTLRNCTNIDDVCYPRREVRTLHEGVKAKGNSKLISQTDWIQGKDQQGYRFKNCANLNVPLPTLKTILR